MRDDPWESIDVALAIVQAALEADVRVATSLVEEAETVERPTQATGTYLLCMEQLRRRVDELCESIDRQRVLLEQLRRQMQQLRAQRRQLRPH